MRSCRRPSSTSSAPRAWWPPSRASRQQERPAGQALKDGKKIIVCTIQTFPFALKAVQELAATEGKRFAVIADEAHSSQTGEAAAKLKQVLSAEELGRPGRTAARSHRGPAGRCRWRPCRASQDKGITYVAFTATPKAKTLELFGRPRGPPACLQALPRLLHAPGHRGGLHPRRAEELHALQAGLQAGQRRQGVRREAGRAQRGHEGAHALGAPAPLQHRQKVQVVVEHFRENVQPLLNGQAKAMVVVGSRKEAVRWQLAIRPPTSRSNGYKLGRAGGLLRRGQRPESYPDP
jgi:type I restriction enzyme R subunit